MTHCGERWRVEGFLIDYCGGIDVEGAMEGLLIMINKVARRSFDKL